MTTGSAVVCLDLYICVYGRNAHALERRTLLLTSRIHSSDCGSSLYTELEVMPDAVCIKAGGIDDKEVRDFKKTSVEFYCKDRMAYSKAVEGAEQKPVSLGFFHCWRKRREGGKLTVFRCLGKSWMMQETCEGCD